VKLCFVVQRYGLEVTGGAETHCRWLAARLAKSHAVEVVTTCALEYAEWRNHYPAGSSEIQGIRVTRHPVERPRDPRRFALYSDIVFRDNHTPADERTWIEENGPLAPSLVESLGGMRDVDLFIFYSYRYYTSFFGLPRVRERAVLVPTAEDDAALRLSVFAPLLNAPRGLLYLTPEEQELVARTAGNRGLPSVVIGSGIQVAEGWRDADVRARFSLPERYILYVGRVDWAKGVDQLVRYHRQLAEEWPELPSLVLAGKPVMEVAPHPKLRLLGEISEPEKGALMAGSLLLVLPSALESLSLSVLEAWSFARPVLVNAACPVLEGQCVRSNGGLFYRGYVEFAPALRLLVERADLRQALGEAGRAYVAREYDWDVVETRTAAFLASLLAPREAPTPAGA
jgi:glycosyltransferase involved in cell wall biosynthesis